jgi:hypothetical protein
MLKVSASDLTHASKISSLVSCDFGKRPSIPSHAMLFVPAVAPVRNLSHYEPENT